MRDIIKLISQCCFLMVLIGLASSAPPADTQAIGEASAAINRAQPPRLDVNSDFPDSCLVDFSFRLSPPAGNQGFLFVGTNGHFYFQDGSRARFWGINVAKDAVFQPHSVIEQVAALFARTGLNLVRFHHLDDVGGLLPADHAGRQPRIDPEKLDSLDYWIAALKQRGIYVYLDLLDYRTFWPQEGVANAEALGRGAKPYALFDERLIELQQQYAHQLLVDHVNPYTGLSYAQDPAVVMIELCDENGLLACQGRWGQIVSPYREQLLRRWNRWLRNQYQTTTRLKEAWSPAGDGSALASFESLTEGTVGLPGISPPVPNPEARAADVRRFAASLHRDYFAQMRDFLRGAGVKVPLTAVTDTEYPADLFAVASELDFIGANYYFAHPVMKDSQPPDVLAYFDAQSPLLARGPDTAIRRLCGPRVVGKPLVIREWNVCWPNEHRAAGLVETAVYGAIQAVDAMILFTYDCRPGSHKLSYFDVSVDPTRWGLVALAGEVFRTERPQSDQRFTVAFNQQDIYDSPDETLVDAVYEAGRQARVSNWFPGCPTVAGDVVYLRPHARQSPSQILLRLAPPGGVRRVTKVSPTTQDRPASLGFAAETVQVIAGRIANKDSDGPDDWQVKSATDQGAVIWCSLDGQPPATSRRWVIKMVSGAQNTGQRTREHYITDYQQIHALLQAGAEPVITGGEISSIPTIVSRAGAEVIRVDQRGGTWELVHDGDEWFFCTDTPGIRIELPSLPGTVYLTTVTEAGAASRTVTQPIVYPDEVLLVKISPPEGVELADE